ncbi:Hypothetical_protein [Hexamita inflata]|uniref:Hypothetical_protein n=1 Tax=Hexamita inflata TaxID=28002 RepID=A0AA86V246_9EUKA|nr:Hypothetical protein HINF_LOCUS42738 [Hexamita inflata]
MLLYFLQEWLFLCTNLKNEILTLSTPAYLQKGQQALQESVSKHTTQPCLQGSSLFAYKGVTIFISLISKTVSKMYLVEMSNLKDLWLKNKVKNYGICHLLIREFCMKELPYK